MLKTIILTITILFAFTACLHKENPQQNKIHHKVTPKLNHSFYY